MRVSELDGCTDAELDNWDHVLEAAPALLAVARKAELWLSQTLKDGLGIVAPEFLDEIRSAIKLAEGRV